MIKVAHLVDDLNLGGVNRCLDAQLPHLDPRFTHTRLAVLPTREVPPALDAAIIVVHFTTSWAKLPWLFGLRARNPQASVILMEHSYTRAFEALYVKHRTRFRALLRVTYGLVSHVISVSHGQCAWLIEATGLPRSRFTVLNPFTDLRSSRKLELPVRAPGPLRLGALGRYAPQKGFDTLIAAMRLVSPDIATLRLVGLGPDEAMLRRMAEGMPHVTVEGPVADPAMLLGAVDALAIPSRFEAFGCVAAEARAAGRPMIVSTVDGLCDHAVSSPELVIPAEDPQALANAIVWLAGQDVAALGSSARKSVAHIEAETVAAWNSVLRGVAEPDTGRLAALAAQ
jgi:glycosyltransferase involved in cell wall biosynthesis